MARALGNPARLEIVSFLRSHAGCFTGNIVNSLPLAQATVSQHLKVLRSAGIIQGTTSGPATSYCLDARSLEWFAEQTRTMIPPGGSDA